ETNPRREHSGSCFLLPPDSSEAPHAPRCRRPTPRDPKPLFPGGEPGMALLLRRRVPLLRLLRQLHTESVASTSSSSTLPPPLQNPRGAASPPVAPGSRRLGFLNATPLASAHRASTSSSAAAYLAIGAAAALASLPVVYADGNEQGPVGPAVSTDPTEGEDLARKEKKRIMELVQSQGMQRGSYPQFDVAVKGQ
ncbi:unnamed protein product, partial [Urochloa humidicola]